MWEWKSWFGWISYCKSFFQLSQNQQMLIIVRWGVALGMSQFILAAIMWGIEGLWQQQRSSLKPPFSITVLVQAETWKIIGSQNKWWICSCLQYGKFSSLFFSSFKLQKKDGRGRLKVNTVHTSLFVSFSVALDKNQTFTNNNVFHKLSRPTFLFRWYTNLDWYESVKATKNYNTVHSAEYDLYIFEPVI